MSIVQEIWLNQSLWPKPAHSAHFCTIPFRSLSLGARLILLIQLLFFLDARDSRYLFLSKDLLLSCIRRLSFILFKATGWFALK